MKYSRFCLALCILLSSLCALTAHALDLRHYHALLIQQAQRAFPLTDKPMPTVSQAQARQYFRKSDFAKAYQALYPYAIAGDVTAIMQCGFMSEFGQGVVKNTKKATLWYFLAVRNNEYNQKPLSRAIKAYFGVQQAINYTKAAMWMRMAAELSVDRY